jgi:translocator protein
MSTATELKGFAGWLLVVAAVGALGAFASQDAAGFYAQLMKPAWAPPAALFGPVWSFLYLLMGVAAWLIWRMYGFSTGRMPLTLFLMQLGLNALWSWLFFAWHLGAWALADVVALWLLILATTIAFWRLRPLAGALLIPYLLWVSFAAALNFVVWRLNPQLL